MLGFIVLLCAGAALAFCWGRSKLRIIISVVAGGMLSYDSDKMKEGLDMDMPTTEMALRFVLSNPNVSTVCSGMTSLEMLRQNAKTVFDFDPANSKTHEEMCEGLDKLISATGGNLCTSCGYCMPCPQNVNIPHFMNIQKNIDCFGLTESGKEQIENTPKE